MHKPVAGRGGRKKASFWITSPKLSYFAKSTTGANDADAAGLTRAHKEINSFQGYLRNALNFGRDKQPHGLRS